MRCSSGWLVAASTRASLVSSAVPPSRRKVRSSSTLSSFGCTSATSSPTSSRNSVPRAGDLEQPALGLLGVGEGAALVPEQLTLEEGRGQRRAVHLDERLRGARGALVDPTRDVALARARLADDEHGNVVVARREVDEALERRSRVARARPRRARRRRRRVARAAPRPRAAGAPAPRRAPPRRRSASRSTGFSRKSSAPCCIARTAVGTSAWPVSMMMPSSGSSARSASSSVSPLASGSRRSTSTTSGACSAAACRPSVAVRADRAA